MPGLAKVRHFHEAFLNEGVSGSKGSVAQRLPSFCCSKYYKLLRFSKPQSPYLSLGNNIIIYFFYLFKAWRYNIICMYIDTRPPKVDSELGSIPPTHSGAPLEKNVTHTNGSKCIGPTHSGITSKWTLHTPHLKPFVTFFSAVTPPPTQPFSSSVIDPNSESTFGGLRPTREVRSNGSIDLFDSNLSILSLQKSEA